MKNLLLIILVCFIAGKPSRLQAQEKESIHFLTKASFDEALNMADRQDKMVFIDCFTSWCAPCKWMEQNVFVNDSVYKFYNKHFINFKIDMEKGEGPSLRKKYGVKSFPTYLFVNEQGDIVHRTASRMEAADFLKEGQKAIDPTAASAHLKEKYEQGDRSNRLLYQYAIALRKINRDEASRVGKELLAQITGEDLKSELGWKIIRDMARNENDRLGKFLIGHRHFYDEIAGTEAVSTVLMRLGMYTMYGLIRNQDSTVFFERLNLMKQHDDATIQRNVAMLEMEYYLKEKNADSFVVSSNRAMNGIFKFNDRDLSFIARRANYMGKDNTEILNQALVLARKAVDLNPEEYSNQGTLASICLELKRKEEGLKAARKARELANVSTSKIQKLAQKLVDKLEQL